MARSRGDAGAAPDPVRQRRPIFAPEAVAIGPAPPRHGLRLRIVLAEFDHDSACEGEDVVHHRIGLRLEHGEALAELFQPHGMVAHAQRRRGPGSDGHFEDDAEQAVARAHDLHLFRMVALVDLADVALRRDEPHAGHVGADLPILAGEGCSPWWRPWPWRRASRCRSRS